MPADVVAAAEREPRAGRYLIRQDTPRRTQILAACAVLGLLVHLLFAQLTLVLAVLFHGTTRVSRWRPQWLAVPAVAGTLWTLAVGPASAVAGFTLGPGRVAAYLGGIGGHPARLVHLTGAYAGITGWLPRQFPLALVAASAEAAVAAWLGWLHTDEWNLPAYRRGLLSFCRRRYLSRSISAGGLVTRDGVCLGYDKVTGLRAAMSWPEAEGGVLCTGSPGSGVTTTSFQLMHAAIRRRKPVIAVDLDGSNRLADSLAAVCAATRTPLHMFPGAGRSCYDPLRAGDPARRTSLVMGMVDWTGTADACRRSCGAYLTDLFTVIDAAPGDPLAPMLDEIAGLLRPAALRARVEQVPAYHPRRQVLGERVNVSASLIEADPRITATLTEQLNELRASAFAGWLAPVPDGRTDLGRVIRERAVVLFSLDRSVHGRAAVTMASLVAFDALALCAELRGIGAGGDGLIWFDQCDGLPPAALTELASRGGDAGMATVAATTAPDWAREMADLVNVLVLHRLGDPDTAERFAGYSGEKLVPADGEEPLPRSVPPRFVSGPQVPARSLGRLGNGEHVLIVRRPQRRVVTLGLTVPARVRWHQAVRSAADTASSGGTVHGTEPVSTGLESTEQRGTEQRGAGQKGTDAGAVDKGRST
jgi:hypothetical protein